MVEAAGTAAIVEAITAWALMLRRRAGPPVVTAAIVPRLAVGIPIAVFLPYLLLPRFHK